MLPSQPAILPARHYVYPRRVEEVERGALEVMVRPAGALPFLATCALGFASESVPSGIWACPHPDALCAVAGGYAYIVDTGAPERWEQVEFRPVTVVRPLPEQGLLLFAGFHAVIAWNRDGLAWRSRRLSWEGVRLGEARGDLLRGWGWDLHSDSEMPFELNLRTGEHTGGPAF